MKKSCFIQPFFLTALFLLNLSPHLAAEESGVFVPLKPEVAPNFHPSEDIESGLWMIMDKAEIEVKHSPNRITDPAINTYLEDIVCRLAQEYCGDIRVYITRYPYFNASMSPNGMMVIWSGLLLRVENEDQLAAIIGHELGHYLKRHSINTYLDIKSKSNLSVIFSLGLAVAGVGIASSITDLMLTSSIYAHKREYEHEADKYGIQLMQAAGYDTREAAKVWDTLIKEDKAAKDYDDSGIPFFASHPPPEDRFTELNRYAEQLSPIKKAYTDNTKFAEITRDYWPIFLADQIKLNEPGKSEYLLNSLQKKQAYLGTIHFFKGELYRQRKEDGDISLAKKQYALALDYPDTPKEVFRELGLLELKQRNMTQARMHFTSYLTHVPNANDREMIKYYLSMEN